MSYILDANVFISAKNLHYGIDFCPAFWEWLIHAGQRDVAFSIDKVADEIGAQHDELTEWAANDGVGLFRRSHGALSPHLARVSEWCMQQQFTPAAQTTFFQAADYYLLAHALAGGHVIVTHETASTSQHRIKIPNVCLGLGVQFTSPFQMLRRENALFVLRNQGG